jgi:hypothetical protein
MSVGCSPGFQGQSCSGEAAFDESGLVLDLLQAVPDALDLSNSFVQREKGNYVVIRKATYFAG